MKLIMACPICLHCIHTNTWAYLIIKYTTEYSHECGDSPTLTEVYTIPHALSKCEMLYEYLASAQDAANNA